MQNRNTSENGCERNHEASKFHSNLVCSFHLGFLLWSLVLSLIYKYIYKLCMNFVLSIIYWRTQNFLLRGQYVKNAWTFEKLKKKFKILGGWYIKLKGHFWNFEKLGGLPPFFTLGSAPAIIVSLLYIIYTWEWFDEAESHLAKWACLLVKLAWAPHHPSKPLNHEVPWISLAPGDLTLS